MAIQIYYCQSQGQQHKFKDSQIKPQVGVNYCSVCIGSSLSYPLNCEIPHMRFILFYDISGSCGLWPQQTHKQPLAAIDL